MKRVLMTVLAASVMFCAGCHKIDNTAVVKVNDTIITKQEVEDIVDKQMNNPFFAKLDKKSDDMVILTLFTRDRAINELIVKKIIEEEVIKRNIQVSEEDLTNYKENLLKQIGGEENFKELLSKNNMNEEQFKEMVSNEIQVTKLVNAISPINVSDADVKKFYNDNKVSKFTHPDSVRASHILIKKEDKAKAEKVLAEAKAPNADFAALAKKYSEDTGSAANGGDLGFFGKEQMVKPFADAAFSMKPDTVSDLVESEFGYHIIKVTDRKKAGVTPYDEVKAEIKKYLSDEKKVAILQKFIEGKKSQVKVEYLLPEYNPEEIKKQVQEIGKKKEVAPQPTQAPQTETEEK